ncbi:MAG: PAS domain S-box protein, partial [Gammaproteobacteria bacterium]|nr:PAS domain S-box protein [Gammaproteobacteria bacterium]
MIKVNSDSNSNISLEQKILQEQVRLLYDGMRLSLFASVAISTILCYLMWDQVESNQSVILWFTILLSITLLRALDTLLYKNRHSNKTTDSQWKQRFFIGSTSAGTWWGLAIWFMHPADNSYVVILVLIIVGIVSGATSTLSYRWEAMFAFMLCALGLPALKLIYVGGEFSWVLALMLAIFFLFAISSTKRIYQNTQQNVRLRIESTVREQALNYAQQKQQLHTQQTPLAVMEWDLDFKVIEWNPSAERIFGFKRDDMLGQSIIDSIITKSSIHKVEKYWQELLDSKKPLENIVIENQTSDKSRIFCEWFVTPLVDNNDKVVAITAQVLDITSQKKADSELILAKETAEKASKAKSEFLASMSHELRTPLNAILGFSQLLELEQGLQPQQKENVSAIYKAGKHLLELINQILDLARIEAGRLELSIEPVSLEKLLNECKSLIAPLADKQSIQLQFDNISCNCFAYADYTRLKQVLVNLLSNAVKYNRSKGTVWVSCSTGDENYWKISVKDTGYGIDSN